MSSILLSRGFALGLAVIVTLGPAPSFAGLGNLLNVAANQGATQGSGTTAQVSAAVQSMTSNMQQGLPVMIGGRMMQNGMLAGCPLLSGLPVATPTANASTKVAAKAKQPPASSTGTSINTSMDTQANVDPRPAASCPLLSSVSKSSMEAKLKSLERTLDRLKSPDSGSADERVCSANDLTSWKTKLDQVDISACDGLGAQIEDISGQVASINAPVDACVGAMASAVQKTEQDKERIKADMAQKRDAMNDQAAEAKTEADKLNAQIDALQKSKVALQKAGDAGTGSTGAFASMKKQFSTALESVHTAYASAVETKTQQCIADQMARMSEQDGPYGNAKLNQKRAAQLATLSEKFSQRAQGIHFLKGSSTMVTQGSTDSYVRDVVSQISRDFTAGKLIRLVDVQQASGEATKALSADAVVACVQTEMRTSDATKATKKALTDSIESLKPQMKDFEASHTQELDAAMDALGTKTSLTVSSCNGAQLDGVISSINSSNGEPSQDWANQLSAPFDQCQKDMLQAMNGVLDGGANIPAYHFRPSAGLVALCSAGNDQAIPGTSGRTGTSMCQFFSEGAIGTSGMGTGLRNAAKYLDTVVKVKAAATAKQFDANEKSADLDAKNAELAMQQMVTGAIQNHLTAKKLELAARLKALGLPEGYLTQDCGGGDSNAPKVCKLVPNKDLKSEISKDLAEFKLRKEEVSSELDGIHCGARSPVKSPDLGQQKKDCDNAFDSAISELGSDVDFKSHDFQETMDRYLAGSSIASGSTGCWHDGKTKSGVSGTLLGPSPASVDGN